MQSTERCEDVEFQSVSKLIYVNNLDTMIQAVAVVMTGMLQAGSQHRVFPCWLCHSRERRAEGDEMCETSLHKLRNFFLFVCFFRETYWKLADGHLFSFQELNASCFFFLFLVRIDMWWGFLSKHLACNSFGKSFCFSYLEADLQARLTVSPLNIAQVKLDGSQFDEFTDAVIPLKGFFMLYTRFAYRYGWISPSVLSGMMQHSSAEGNRWESVNRCSSQSDQERQRRKL